MGDGRWAMGDGRWAMGDGRWAMGDGRWAMGDGRWAMGRWRTLPLGRGGQADTGALTGCGQPRPSSRNYALRPITATWGRRGPCRVPHPPAPTAGPAQRPQHARAGACGGGEGALPARSRCLIISSTHATHPRTTPRTPFATPLPFRHAICARGPGPAPPLAVLKPGRTASRRWGRPRGASDTGQRARVTAPGIPRRRAAPRRDGPRRRRSARHGRPRRARAAVCAAVPQGGGLHAGCGAGVARGRGIRGGERYPAQAASAAAPGHRPHRPPRCAPSSSPPPHTHPTPTPTPHPSPGGA
jgi:hypothetical protein